MNGHIILTQQQAQQIEGNYGIYSAIKPIKTFDGKYIIPEACLSDIDLQSINATLQSISNPQNTLPIEDLPSVGVQCIIGRYYNYESEITPLVKCVQTHNRTIYPPEQTPALFSFYRPNTPDLLWMPNEQVEIGWKRWYNNKQYNCIQAHMTLETWTPDVTPALWVEIIPVGVKPPQWVSANWAQYTPIGFEVFDLGKVWSVKTLTHTWIQPALTGNGAISWSFVKDWI